MRVWWMGLAAACVTDAEVDRVLDRDGDGFRAIAAGGLDCDDGSAAVFPGAAERCDDEIDNNCDGVIDDFGIGDATWFEDADGDGAGRDDRTRRACADSDELQADGWSLEGGDCDDADAKIGPRADELCDGVDNDCNDVVDDVMGVATTSDGSAWATVDEGIAAALAGGGELALCAGVHDVGSVEVVAGSSLELTGVGATETVLVAAPGSTLFDVEGSLGLTGVTVQGPAGGTGVFASGSARVQADDCVVRDARTGVRVQDDASMTLVGTQLVANGSGSLGEGGLVMLGGSTTLHGGTVRDNHGRDGGGLSVTSGTVTVADTTFQDNEGVRGGGLFADASTVDLVGVELFGNLATDGGGGWFDGQVSLDGTRVTDNRAAVGAGLYVAGGMVNLDAGSVVERNLASDHSGGAHVAQGILVLQGVDFGTGANDNQPQDLQLADGITDIALGAVSTTTCNSSGCSP